MKKLLLAVLCGATLVGSGCATLKHSDQALLQGNWNGHIVEAQTITCTFTIKENTFEFRVPQNDVRYQGTFTLREDTVPKQFIATITDSSLPQHIGKTSLAIYDLQEGTLKLTGNEPGQATPPATFEAPGTARVEFKKN